MEELAAALRDLHRALTERVRRDYEREQHCLLSPGEFLHLLISEPRLAWIRPLSELMVDLDVFLQADPSPTGDEAAAVRTEVDRFIAPEPGETLESFAAFARQYWPYINDDPQIAMAHARVQQAIEGLPEAASVNEAEELHERHRWAELRRHRR